MFTSILLNLNRLAAQVESELLQVQVLLRAPVFPNDFNGFETAVKFR